MTAELPTFLYFAKYTHRGQVVWGGHFLAYDAALAKHEASEAFERDRATALRHLLPLGPMACECILTVVRSTASHANAINAKAAETWIDWPPHDPKPGERGFQPGCGCCSGPLEDRCCCHFHADIRAALMPGQCSLHHAREA